ncbi:6-phosphogluconolactonase [Gemmobacter megaterium]|uniref:6-phosphogluconolactonase n=1 Tax=Gemmobacter megaterium TaxID=1086013 RepID=A0A1N7P9Q0_9RHOB|nr:6-phosphogluconolactonase [Gemmobacter megaterium]GGE19611.1 6-phosphogluconolactonase [Gemmobacter megaterium]SIT07246.1 6-phosphogluconolactonase [Gemmobacter megaterium]
MEFREYPDAEALFLALASQIAGELGQALRGAGTATIALPGGSTPGPLLDLLSDVDLDWMQVTVLPTDERWVPETDPRSNARLIRSRLLQGAAAGARLLPLYVPSLDPAAAAARLGADVSALLPLTTAVLGMGADMHTASLFPEADHLELALASDAPPVIDMTAPAAPEPRVTLSAGVLKGAMNLHLVILGADKRAALERAQGLPPELAPVRAVLDNATVHWAE